MSPACCPSSHSDQSVPSPAIPSAGEPTDSARSEHEASLSLVAQLRARIEAADTHLMRMLHLAEIGESCIANMHPVHNAIDPCGRLFEQIRERVELAREMLITDNEREDEIFGRVSTMNAPPIEPEARPMSDAEGSPGRTFNAIDSEGVLIEIEALLDAIQIVHGTFHECDDLEGVRRVCGALDPVIGMTVAETAKLRAMLFGAEG